MRRPIGVENDLKIRVTRVGGSLLTWNEVSSVLRRWLQVQPTSHNVLLAGGGPWVELLRQATKRFDIPEAEAHVMCLRALSVTTSLVGQVCHCPVADNLDSLAEQLRNDNKATTQTIAFDVYEHLQNVDARRAHALPKTWNVTSDSIAARIATDLGASELVLLKSSKCPANPGDHHHLGELGYVDPYFATAARGLNVRFVNLRSF